MHSVGTKPTRELCVTLAGCAVGWQLSSVAGALQGYFRTKS